jgi:hypothetical protein
MTDSTTLPPPTTTPETADLRMMPSVLGNTLQLKLQSQSLTPEEHQELLSLVDVVERSKTERLQNLIARN